VGEGGLDGTSAAAQGAAATPIPTTAAPMAVMSSLFVRVWVVVMVCLLSVDPGPGWAGHTRLWGTP
jgi:hypothetical protein